MNIQDVLSRDEIDEVCRRNNVHGAWLFLCNYAITAAIFVIMAVWPNPLTILLGIVLLGGRQLGFFVLVHECGHGTLFDSKRLNEFAGDWLAASLTFDDMGHYARGHRAHHRLAGTHEDPDLPNYQDYPISRDRLRRKLLRDITAQTGIRQTAGLFRAFANFQKQPPGRRLSLARGLVVNALMLAVFVYLGVAWLYLVWWVALLTSFRLISRLRQVAEHANVPDLYDLDPRLNTRTIEASWFDRLVFCPLGVSYHLEHHMMASVPVYNLPKLHGILRAKGFYDDVEFPRSYAQMLGRVTVPA